MKQVFFCGTISVDFKKAEDSLFKSLVGFSPLVIEYATQVFIDSIVYELVKAYNEFTLVILNEDGTTYSAVYNESNYKKLLENSEDIDLPKDINVSIKKYIDEIIDGEIGYYCDLLHI